MVPAAKELFVALDARAVSAAALESGLWRRRLRRFARVPLAPGALVPSAGGENVQRPEEVREAIRRVIAEVGQGTPGVTLVLPDGVARLALVESGAAGEMRDIVRFRLAASLPWPVQDSIVNALAAGRGRVVGAAVRRDTVAAYENVARTAGLSLRTVRLTPLLVAEAAMRARGAAVHVAVSDTAVSFVATRSGVVAVRGRRRDASSGEADRLLAEAERTARLAGHDGGAAARLVLWGSDAARLRQELAATGAEVLAPEHQRPEADECAWITGVLA